MGKKGKKGGVSMGDGIRKTIYVPSQGVWEAIKGAAEKDGISISRYIIRQCLGSRIVSKTTASTEQLDRIEGKIDKLLKAGVAPTEEQLICNQTVEGSSPSISSKKEVIKDTQGKIEKVKGKKPLEREKYQKRFPDEKCVRCGNLNRDCICYG